MPARDSGLDTGSLCAIVQARMGSERLPGKTLLALADKPVLAHVIERLRVCKNLDCLAVATSVRPADDAIVSLCKALSVQCVRGSENDVLERFVEAGSAIGAETIVRVTGDNPLIDPAIVDALADAMRRDPKLEYCFASNAPLGTSCEAVRLGVLRRVQALCDRPDQREHVTLFIRENPQLFNVMEIRSSLGTPGLRLTLDTEEDFEMLSAVFAALYHPGELLAVRDVIRYLQEHESVMRLNRDVRQRRPGNPVV